MSQPLVGLLLAHSPPLCLVPHHLCPLSPLIRSLVDLLVASPSRPGSQPPLPLSPQLACPSFLYIGLIYLALHFLVCSFLCSYIHSFYTHSLYIHSVSKTLVPPQPPQSDLLTPIFLLFFFLSNLSHCSPGVSSLPHWVISFPSIA